MVEGHLKNIPVKLFQNPFSGLGGGVVLRFFCFFFSSGAILFSGAEPLGNFGRGSPTEHSCKIISKSIHWFRRRRLLSKLLTDARRKTHDGRRLVTKAHLEPLAQVS